jgi:flagellar biosynthesis/type III secretory pathway protein FliH
MLSFLKKEGYKSDHVILDNLSHENDLKDFYFTFVELPKFTKTLEELKTIEDRWYYFLKHADESKDIEAVLSNHPEIKAAYEILDRYHWTEGELQWYEKLIMNTADAQGMIDAAKTEAREEGHREGRRKGHEEGLQEGHKKGCEEGRQAALIETAKAMLEKGFSVDQVALATALPQEDILPLLSAKV